MPERAVAEEKLRAKNNAADDARVLSAAEAREAVRAEQETAEHASWETQLFQVYRGSVSLRYPHIEPGDTTAQYTMEPAALPLQEGVFVAPDAAQVSAYHTMERKGVIFTALGGRVELAIANFRQEKEAELATMNLVSDRFLSPTSGGPTGLRQTDPEAEQDDAQTDDTEISAYFRDTVVLEPIEGIRIELGQGEYIKNKNEQNPKLRFPKTRLVFAARSLTDFFLTELDGTGLHTPKEQEVQLNEQEKDNIPAAKVLAALRADGNPETAEEAAVEAEEKETAEAEEKTQEAQPQEKQEPEWKGFWPGDLTQDQFVQLEEAEYESREAGVKEQSGKGRFRFREIPYTIPLFNGKELTGKTKETETGEEMLPFYVDPLGNLSVDFEKPIELPLTDREEIARYLVAAISLEDASIQGSRLTAGKIRIDLGVAAAKEDEEEEEEEEEEDLQSDEGRAKKLFGKNLHGTFANISAVESLDDTGIHAAPGRKSLGQFGVSKFLGFLDVTGDYPTGYLKAAFESQKEADKKKLFSETVQNVFGEGISIPLIGPLAFELSVSPSVSIGGSLSAEMRRGKSFGEALSQGESMQLAGSAGIEGEGKLDMAAGLALKPGLISSVRLDLKVGSELSAGIGVTAEAETALGMQDERLKQTEPLDLDGRVEIQLKGNVNLSSNVQFFVWHATLFQVDLYNKEVQIQPFQGHASRDAGAEGLTKGWHFEKMGLSAKGLGEKTVEAMRDAKDLKKVREQKLEMSREAAESLGKDVESAWTLLEELKRQGGFSKDRAYLVDGDERAALEKRIAEMTNKVRDKIEKYMTALGNYKGQLYRKAEDTKAELEKARKERRHCMGQDTLRQMMLRDVQRGGFRMEEYQPLSEKEIQEQGLDPQKIQKENKRRNQKAAIDLTIARTIGIYDNALDEQIYEYDMLARERNYQSDVDRRQGRKNPYQEFTYPLFKELGMENLLKGIRKEDGTYWYGGARATLYENTKFGHDKNANLDPLKHKNNYFHVLYDENMEYENIPLSYRAKFAPVFVPRNAQGELTAGKKGIGAVRKYEFLKILLSGVYPQGSYDAKGNSLEGKPIPRFEAKDKTELFKMAFKDTLSEDDRLSNFLAWFDLDTRETTQREKMMADVNKVLQEVFESNLDEMVAGGKTDMKAKLQELDDRLEASKTAYIQAAERHYEIEQAIKTVTKEQAKYTARLFGLKLDVEEGMKLERTSVSAARAAVNFVQDEYEAIAAGGKLPDLAVNGLREDSEAYREMKKYEEEAFPGRKNAGKALKASVAQ